LCTFLCQTNHSLPLLLSKWLGQGQQRQWRWQGQGRAVATRATTWAIVSRAATSTVAMAAAILPAMAMVDSVLDVGNDPLGGSDDSITGCRPPGDCYCEIVCPARVMCKQCGICWQSMTGQPTMTVLNTTLMYISLSN